MTNKEKRKIEAEILKRVAFSEKYGISKMAQEILETEYSEFIDKVEIHEPVKVRKSNIVFRNVH